MKENLTRDPHTETITGIADGLRWPRHVDISKNLGLEEFRDEETPPVKKEDEKRREQWPLIRGVVVLY
jgi:hypothetical protein